MREAAAELGITVDIVRFLAFSNFAFLTVVHLSPCQRVLILPYPPPKKRLTQPGSPPPSEARL